MKYGYALVEINSTNLKGIKNKQYVILYFTLGLISVDSESTNLGKNMLYKDYNCINTSSDWCSGKYSAITKNDDWTGCTLCGEDYYQTDSYIRIGKRNRPINAFSGGSMSESDGGGSSDSGSTIIYYELLNPTTYPQNAPINSTYSIYEQFEKTNPKANYFSEHFYAFVSTSENPISIIMCLGNCSSACHFK